MINIIMLVIAILGTSILVLVFACLGNAEKEYWDEWTRSFTCGRYKTYKEFINRRQQ